MLLNCPYKFRRCRWRTIPLRWIFVLFFVANYNFAGAQDILKDAIEAPSPNGSASPSPVSTPIPLSAILVESEAAISKVRKTDSFIAQQTINKSITDGLPAVAEDVKNLNSESDALRQNRVSLEELGKMERDWTTISNKLSGWKSSVLSKVTAIEEKITELGALRELWQRSIDELGGPAGRGNTAPTTAVVPEELELRAKETLSAIANAQKRAEEKRSEFLTVESRISELQSTVTKAVDDIKKRREGELSKLLVRDSVSFWSADWFSGGWSSLVDESKISISSQWDELIQYFHERFAGFVGHAFLLGFFTLGLFGARRRIAPMIESEPRLEKQAAFFRMPIVSALILSFLFVSFLYPHPPRLLSAILGVFAILPGVLILRQLVERPVNLLLYFVLGLFLFDRFRDVFHTLVLTSRVMFSFEIFVTIAFLAWFYRSEKLAASVEAGAFRIFGLIRKIIPFAIAIFVVSLTANAFGFVSLSVLIGNSSLRSAYIGLFLYAAARIIVSVASLLIRIYPLSTLHFVRHNHELVMRHVKRIVNWIGLLSWFSAVLNLLSLRDVFWSWASAVVAAGVNWGSVSISVGDILLFVLVVWLAYMLSRFTRFILAEDVYPRIELSGGISYAISTIIHYLFLIGGFLLAVSALGFELSKFAILAGAVGIGLGFGLQNIINNFVSGLILLFERPVKVGDLVQVGQHQGTLNSIGLRASVVRKVDGSDVILPNSKLISEEVVNWTLSDELRRLEIPFGVAYGTEPEKVIEIITDVAIANPEIMKDPKPKTLFRGFGDSALDFELRAWTGNSDDWVAIRSQIVTEIYAALVKEAIEIPFPQRDLNIRNLPASADVFRDELSED